MTRLPAANLLADEASPYLLQHKDNPVHWRGWSAAALAEARAADKPILLSIGYAACHWCHVMAHESFENDAIAALMNELFVNIKVDREERPDLDQIYQSALALLGQQGGWPLTMFLTPDGKPFWGGTYFPPDPRYGRPGFPQVLQGIAQAYRDKPEQVAQNVAAIGEALAKQSAREAGGMVAVDMVDQVAERLAEEIDPIHGGIKGAPKFPQVSILALLWRAHRRRLKETETQRHAVTISLDRMCQGGIYDHLGGGFARYSTDAHWLVPHFEKMLYDNAQLVALLTLVWQETKSPLYAARVAETVGWLAREMMAEGDTFAATLDADSEGMEGKFYVWTVAEIDALLGALAGPFKDAYDAKPGGNWLEDHGHGPPGEKIILNRLKRMLLGDAAHEDRLARAREILLAARAHRIRPGRDDKILADWNGMMIAALARAGFAFDRPDWVALGATAYAGIKRLLADGSGRLIHSYRAGRTGAAAMLDDYAHMIAAALALNEVAGDPAYLADAKTWTATADALFSDPEGGYFFTASDADDVIVRTKHANDNAVPSGNGVMAANLARLFYLTGETAYRERAAATIAAFSSALARNFFPLSTLLDAAVLLEHAVQVVIVGTDEAQRRPLLRALAETSVPELVLQTVGPDGALPAGHPAHGKGMIDGRATAYVCRGPVCSPPVTAPDDLRAVLAS
ncbi:MAG: thioredoxin domain-containing protein [Alphaproteobacteria bacterium]|nr:thioredoxin domain-containing protein [Alphaproteobacteria bacterium]